MRQLAERCREFGVGEDGATAVEYGLLTALLAVVVIGALAMIADHLTGTFETIGAQLSGANP